MIHGPNVKRLIVQKMSTDAVPSGDGLADALSFITDKEKILAGAKAATEWVELAIRVVREAKEPNPWKTATDEAIAAEILGQIQEKKRTVPH